MSTMALPAHACRRLVVCVLALACLLTPHGSEATDGATTVHVVFSNHLDIGFDNIEPLVGYDHHVLNKYLNEFLPLAVRVADEMVAASPAGGDRYVYTTHSFLLSLLLDCPHTGIPGLVCPDAAAHATVLRGIRQGSITWHAHPHNAQYELYDPSLLAFSFDLTHALDDRFGLPHKRTAVLRDVPGLSRSVIPIFAAKGIKAISVGVNGGSAPPGVPHFTPFIWRDEASGTQLLAFWRPGGYGGVRSETLNLDPPQECIQAPGLQHVLCTSWRNDNAGPPRDAQETLEVYHTLQREWGRARGGNGSSSGGSSASSSGTVRIAASSFDAFVDAVLDALPRLNLPVVTGEIGDTWVFGVQSDPLRTASFRAVSRLRAACAADPGCPSQGAAFFNFSRLLVKVPEHTWGVDIKKTLHDFNYSNSRLFSCLPRHLRPAWAKQPALPQQGGHPAASGDGTNGSSTAQPGGMTAVTPVRVPCRNYRRCIRSWERQAAYVDWALQALPSDHPIVAGYAADLAARRQLAAMSSEGLLTRSSHVGGAQHSTPHAGLLGGRWRLRLLQLWLSRAWQPLVQVWLRVVQHSSSITGARASPAAAAAQSARRARLRTREVAATGSAVHSYTCGSWSFQVDEEAGALTSLRKLYDGGTQPGIDWVQGSSSSSQPGVFAQLVYDAYTESSYDTVWRDYAWQLPLSWWFPLDFGKLNSSQTWDHEERVQARLSALYETYASAPAGALHQLALRFTLPAHLVRHVGAPATMWTVISCPGRRSAPAGWPAGSTAGSRSGGGSDAADAADALHVSVVWQDKTPTRIPEALWLSFRPAAAAVNASSWALHKLDSSISPLDVLRNGSQSMHAVSDAGVSVASANGTERLQLRSWDAALVSPGAPTPFPNGARPPDLLQGMHFNLANNVWGTNYVMWVPYSQQDRNMAFRFSIHASQVQQQQRQEQRAMTAVV